MVTLKPYFIQDVKNTHGVKCVRCSGPQREAIFVCFVNDSLPARA